MNKNIYFGVFDFDETAGYTSEVNTNGVNVERAYCLAAAELFGDKLGKGLFEKVGGLKNRAPRTLVDALLDEGDRSQLLSLARQNITKLNGKLEEFVPKGKGRSLAWNGDKTAPDVVAEAMVRIKLMFLMDEIGTPHRRNLWPRPCPGFRRLWEGILNFGKKHSESSVELVPVIISSGHDLFIRKCFRIWELPEPENLLTNDTMRRPDYDTLSPHDRVKPSTMPFGVFLREWSSRVGAGVDPLQPLRFVSDRGFVAGDCPKIDGGFADNCNNLPFVWFNPQGAESPVKLPEVTVQIGHWLGFSEKLLGEEAFSLMSEGASMAQIFKAVFPPYSDTRASANC